MSQPIPLTFFQHLEELRKRLLICLGAIFLGVLVGYAYSDSLLVFLIAPIRAQIGQVYFFSPAEAFIVKIKIAIFAGMVLMSPVILWQLWVFISPALKKNEKKILIPLVFITATLFFGGVIFSYFTALPFTLQFLVGLQTSFLKPMISISEYVSFVSSLMLAFGVSFNIPLFIWGLVFMGVLSFETLNRYQRHCLVLIFILAAVLTPGPDMASQLSLAIPMTLLFELGVVGAKVIELGRKKSRV